MHFLVRQVDVSAEGPGGDRHAQLALQVLQEAVDEVNTGRWFASWIGYSQSIARSGAQSGRGDYQRVILPERGQAVSTAVR